MTIVTDWEAALAAICEQRGQRLADDIDKLLRERDLVAEAADTSLARDDWRRGYGLRGESGS